MRLTKTVFMIRVESSFCCLISSAFSQRRHHRRYRDVSDPRSQARKLTRPRFADTSRRSLQGQSLKVDGMYSEESAAPQEKGARLSVL